MLQNTATKLLYLRNSILGHLTLLNPWPRGRLSLVTYPNIDDTWDVRAIVVTSDDAHYREGDRGEAVPPRRHEMDEWTAAFEQY